MQIKSLVLITSFLFPGYIFCQNEKTNHQKYWWLRKRLTETFLHIGDKPGESLPGGRLYTSSDGLNHLEFADCTIHLGWYLGVLATENFLLRMHGKSTTQNENELYYALKAFERLDRVSNVLWSYWDGQDLDSEDIFWENSQAQYDIVNEQWLPKFPVSTTPDGFFVREDVPPGLETKLKGVDRVIGASHMVGPVWMTYGYKDGEMSQDQAIGMLMGLSFVNRYVNPSATVSGTHLKSYAQTLTVRMVNYMRSPSLNHSTQWSITNPQRGYQKVKRGEDASALSYPIAWTANNIVHDKSYYGLPIIFQTIQDVAPPNFNNALSITLHPVLRTLRHFPFYDYLGTRDHVNYYMFLTLASTSNLWKDPGAPNGVSYIKQRTSPAEQLGWIIYPLVNHALYPSSGSPYNINDVVPDLDVYPCEAAYNFFSTSGGWSSRWISTNRFQASNGHYEGNPNAHANSHFPGRFNGLDYMLLYNLYRITYAGQIGFHAYESPSDLWLADTYPATPGGEGSTGNPLRIYALNSIHSYSLANSVPGVPVQTAEVEYAAGERIVLLNGFKAHAGAKFRAYISPGGECDALGMKRGGTKPPEEDPKAPGRIVQWMDSLMTFQLQPVEEVWEEADSTFWSVPEAEIFPNPFTDRFTVSCTEPFDQIRLLDVNGKADQIINVGTSEPVSSYTAHPSERAAGTYFILLFNSGRLVGSNTIIKQ